MSLVLSGRNPSGLQGELDAFRLASLERARDLRSVEPLGRSGDAHAHVRLNLCVVVGHEKADVGACVLDAGRRPVGRAVHLVVVKVDHAIAVEGDLEGVLPESCKVFHLVVLHHELVAGGVDVDVAPAGEVQVHREGGHQVARHHGGGKREVPVVLCSLFKGEVTIRIDERFLVFLAVEFDREGEGDLGESVVLVRKFA